MNSLHHTLPQPQSELLCYAPMPIVKHSNIIQHRFFGPPASWLCQAGQSQHSKSEKEMERSGFPLLKWSNSILPALMDLQGVKDRQEVDPPVTLLVYHACAFAATCPSQNRSAGPPALTPMGKLSHLPLRITYCLFFP